MHEPFFTIIVPTRNRAELLPDAIASVLLQDFADFEVIVSDNFNDERTRAAIQPFLKDSRMKIIRTPEVLPMTQHWQFAAEHANGKYVLFVTDRSVLKNGALAKIFKEIQSAGTLVELCSWTWTLYSDQGGYEYGDALLVDPGKPAEILPTEEVARGFTQQPGPFAYVLPRGLNSCFSNDMFKRFTREHGSPFLPVSPDYFSAFLFLGFTPELLHIPQPLFVSQGLSISNGGNGYLGTSESYLSTLGNINWMRHVPIKAPFVDNTIFADFMAAKEKIGGNLEFVQLNRPNYYFACFQELVAKRGAQILTSKRLNEFSAEFERALCEENLDIQRAVRDMIKNQPFAFQLARLRYSTLGGYLRKLKHLIARIKAGTGGQSNRTVMQVAGHSSPAIQALKVNQ